MKIPKMILFDYGQTLIAEQKFDGVKGTEAVLQYATRNKYHLSAEQVQAKANEIKREYMEEMHSIGRFDPEKRHLFQIEIPNTMFTPYLYESQGIEIALSNPEIDTVFWNAAAPGMEPAVCQKAVLLLLIEDKTLYPFKTFHTLQKAL